MAASNRIRFEVPVLLALLAAGCGSKAAKPLIPDGAQLIKQPADPRGILAYEAVDAGTAYVVDVETGKAVFTIPMNFRDQLVVHPAKDMLFFNGSLARQGGLDPKRSYRLYFLKS
jgi:hypothetical protein